MTKIKICTTTCWMTTKKQKTKNNLSQLLIVNKKKEEARVIFSNTLLIEKMYIDYLPDFQSKSFQMSMHVKLDHQQA